MQNSFNKLLATLAVFDLVYLVTMLLESLRKLGLHHDYHVILYPHLLHPLNSISLMCSIYMTIGGPEIYSVKRASIYPFLSIYFTFTFIYKGIYCK